jgi:hypothetical protein
MFDDEYDYEDYDDDYRGGRRRPPPPSDGGEGFETDRNLLRVAAIIVALAAIIIVLIVPPISILDRSTGGGSQSSGGVETKSRGSMPNLPEGLEAASALYDIKAPDTLSGPATLTVRLSKQTQDASNLGFYTYADSQWQRLGAVQPADDGRAASGEVASIPENIAVLRRTASARSMGLILEPGESADPAAPTGGVVSVLAAMPVSGSEQLDLSDKLQGGLTNEYLGVTTATTAEAAAVTRILGEPAAITRHVQAIVTAARTANAKGVHIDYTAIDSSRRAEFTSFIQQLAGQLRPAGLGLVVTVGTPASASDPGGYDWVPLAAAADALWLRPPADPAAYYELLEPALQSKRDSGFELGKVALVVDRSSRDRSGEGVSPISQRDALAIASALQTQLDQGIPPGAAVTLLATNVDQSGGDSGLQWDERARAVSFTYSERSNEHTIWIENRFSLAFRLDLARRYGLGGVVVQSAAKDDLLPDVWNLISQYLEEGKVRLELPYGPYLQPRWQATEGNIELGAASGTAVWNAPARPGVYEITLIVSDGAIFVGQQLSLRVAEAQREPTPPPAGTGTATPTATATATPSVTATATPSATSSATSTRTATATATSTASN